ncbi:MAG: hypothetical protein RBR02_01035 [Desulfuromonadaceae bacterium]|nr:hypothetical protein [Desulfuromonadaceae bacterium]
MPKVFMCRVMLCLSILLCAFGGTVAAQETTLIVRAKANDAKFIGTGIGGVQVSVSHANSGAVLAQGLIRGGTGDTAVLMEKPSARGERISDESAAAFKAVLDIDEPTLLNIRMHGPLGGGSTVVDASQSVWLLPGKDIDGDGIVFNLYGFAVIPLAPYANTKIDPQERVTLSAYVTMLCGCPITQGGIWDAAKYTVEAQIWDEDTLLERVSMQPEDGAGVFSASYVPRASGNYRIIFTAADSTTHNYGVAYTGIAVK